MRTCLWMAVFALSINAYAARPQTEADFWNQAQLSSRFFHKFINNKACHSNFEYESSCYAALEAARGLVGGVVRLPASKTGDFEAAFENLELQLPESIPVQMMRAYAINAHLHKYDPYAGLVPMAQLISEQESVSASYVGIGVNVERNPLGIVIHEVYAGGPAEAAGLKADDVIVKIAKFGFEYEDVDAKDVAGVVELLLQEENTDIKVIVRRAGVELPEFKMKRAVVSVPNSDWTIVEKGVGYLRIRNFDSDDLCGDVETALEGMRRESVDKLVIDLRGNPGGEKYIAMCVTELFTGERPIIGTRYIANTIPELKDVMGDELVGSDTQEIEFENGGGEAVYKGKISVLIDSASASGAEVMSGALQDHKLAWVVGEKSYGKGTAQSHDAVPGNDSLLMIWTSEYFFQPSGRTNQAIGIKPSFEVVARLGQEAFNYKREVDVEQLSARALNGEWEETRPEEAQQIRECIAGKKYDVAALDAFAKAGQPADYQKAYAIAVLKCAP